MKIYTVQVKFQNGDTIQEVIDYLYDLKIKIPDLRVCCDDIIDFDLDAEKDHEEDR